MKKKFIYFVIPALLVLGGLFLIFSPMQFMQHSGTHKIMHAKMHQTPNNEESGMVKVSLPLKLSSIAAKGKNLFDQNCAVCHGQNAAGQQGIAPPLIHKIYEPSHHNDDSFQRAVANGVVSHHWPFGNMPKIAGLNEQDVSLIIAYIRELQQTNDIF